MIGDVLGSVIGGWLAALGRDRSGRRRNERTWAEGREVVFDGWVLGERAYCHPPGGSLVVSSSTLAWPSNPQWHAGRQAIPTDRLRLLRVRARTRADHTSMPAYWSVAECADGLDRVVIACAPDNMRYIRGAIEGSQPGVQPDMR